MPGASAWSARQPGQLGEHVVAEADQPAARQVGGEGVDGLVADPATDGRHQPRTRRPGPGEGRSTAAAGARDQPGVVGVGRQPGRVDVVGHALVEQARRGRGLDHERGDVRLDVEQGGGRAELAYAEPAGLQRRRADGCPSGPGAARCVVPARTRRRRRPGRPCDWPRSEVASAGGSSMRRPACGVEHPAYRPGQAHVALVDVRPADRSDDQVRGRPGTPAPAAVGTGVGEVVEDRPRGTVDLAEQGHDLVVRRARPAAAASRVPRGRGGRGSPTPVPACAAARRALSTTSAEAASRVGSLSCTIACSTASSSASSPSSARSTEALTTTRAASCDESCGAGRREIRPRVEQRRQLLVRPAAQLVGEGAWGGRGHPANSTGAGCAAGSSAWR